MAHGNGGRSCRTEAFVDRTLALVEEGDAITIDAHRQLLQLNIDEALLQERRNRWRLHQRDVTTRGVCFCEICPKSAMPASRARVTDKRNG
ncbi:dihydroxy-acid dehydratase [Pantoea ananatis]